MLGPHFLIQPGEDPDGDLPTPRSANLPPPSPAKPDGLQPPPASTPDACGVPSDCRPLATMAPAFRRDVFSNHSLPGRGRLAAWSSRQTEGWGAHGTRSRCLAPQVTQRALSHPACWPEVLGVMSCRRSEWEEPPRTSRRCLPWYHISQESPVPPHPRPVPLPLVLGCRGHWSFQASGSAGRGPGPPASRLPWVCCAFLATEKL